MAQYSFDPSNNRERADAIKVLKALDPQAFESSSVRGLAQPIGSAYELTQQLTTAKEQVKKLNKDIEALNEEKKKATSELDRFRSEVSKKEKRIGELETRVDELIKLNERQIQKVKEEAEETASNLIKEEEERHQKELEAEAAKYRRLERDSANERRKLETQIDGLKKKLENYEPVGAEDGEEMLYTIDSFAPTPTLIRTNSDDAPYKVVVVSGNDVRFQFNTDKGPSVKACTERATWLLPFCEITAAEEGATTIRWEEWGFAKLSPSGDIRKEDISKPAKIKLTRN